MIYGDNPQKINEREDKLGLKTYSYAPQITSVAQSGNVYVYCINNPILFFDNSGAFATKGQIHNWVVDDIQLKYSSIGMQKNLMIDYRIGWGFADLVNIQTGEVWEVKRASVSIASAIKQLNKYTNNYLHNKDFHNLDLVTGGTKGTAIELNEIIRTMGNTTYFIAYWDCGNGIIQYDYYTVTNWQVIGELAFGFAAIAGCLYLIIQTGGLAAPALVPLIALGG